MFCKERCIDLVFCPRHGNTDISFEKKVVIQQALAELDEALQHATANLRNAHVLTLDNRNWLMDRIADSKFKATQYGCGYLTELTCLAEIIVMMIFRSDFKKYLHCIAQMQNVVLQMQQSLATNELCEGHRKQIAESIEDLWQWVGMNTLNGTRHY